MHGAVAGRPLALKESVSAPQPEVMHELPDALSSPPVPVEFKQPSPGDPFWSTPHGQLPPGTVDVPSPKQKGVAD
jgi:hypothetical protein